MAMGWPGYLLVECCLRVRQCPVLVLVLGIGLCLYLYVYVSMSMFSCFPVDMNVYLIITMFLSSLAVWVFALAVVCLYLWTIDLVFVVCGRVRPCVTRVCV